MRIVVVTTACFLLAYPAQAREFYYFNKSGITREQFIAGKNQCDQLADGVSEPSQTMIFTTNSNLTTGQNALAVGLASLFAGLASGGAKRRSMLVVERTCMADKGYDLYSVDKEIISEIDKIKDDQVRLEKYFELAASSSPIGQRTKE